METEAQRVSLGIEAEEHKMGTFLYSTHGGEYRFEQTIPLLRKKALS